MELRYDHDPAYNFSYYNTTRNKLYLWKNASCFVSEAPPSSLGQTVVKMVTKIKVVREDGGEIDISTAFIRNILRNSQWFFVYLVGAILIGHSSKNRRLGDIVAKTVVVRA